MELPKRKRLRQVPAPVLTTAAFQKLEGDAVPCHILGTSHTWPAASFWQGAAGLEHLTHLVGTQTVQAMASDTGYFQGDMASHEPSNCTFQQFVSSGASSDTTGQTPAATPHHKENVPPVGEESRHLYLAQAPIRSEAPGTPALSKLSQDLQQPAFLRHEPTEINLWMSMRGSCSSLHYDPYQNLLCVVRGSKTVHMYPPGCSPDLAPQPVWGESPNHSPVNSFQPDFIKHPEFEKALSSRVTCTLQAGDALFLPEGWWHQVQSEGITIAVNFWWASDFEQKLGGHMDAYYLRRLVHSMLTSHTAASLATLCGEPAAAIVSGPRHHRSRHHHHHTGPDGPPVRLLSVEITTDSSSDDDDEHEGDAPVYPQFLADPVLDPASMSSSDDGSDGEEGPSRHHLIHPLIHMETEDSSGMETDTSTLVTLNQPTDADDPAGLRHPMTHELASMDVARMRRALVCLACTAPAVAEAFLMRALTPAAAQLLTHRFEQADSLLLGSGRREEQQGFYQSLYGCNEQATHLTPRWKVQ
ncbi:hypothetical protein WJX84_009137 [Apatococcus fuscideae]|uniref:JmjC domain-containing protein n=1 Tax=Apatococcus fuscideae TaxID=2026836 RepID=A0AAW1SYS2_9CHLO